MLSLVAADLPPQPDMRPSTPALVLPFERHDASSHTHPAVDASTMAVGVTVAAGGEQEAGRVLNRAEQDRALFARYLDRRDPVDREMLVERFLPLARQLARRYQRPEEPFDDLFQVACLGLVKAIDRFDLEREVAFSSYAVPTILGEIKRYFRDRTWSVRVPRDLQELALKVDRAVSELTARPPSPADGRRDRREGRRRGGGRPRGARGVGRLQGHLARVAARQRGRERTRSATRSGTEERGFALAEDRATIEHLMRSITPREREVLRLRFAEDLTQAEIGERIGVSQMQVSRIIRQSVARLRAYATARQRPPSDRPPGHGLGAKTPMGRWAEGTQLRTTAHLQGVRPIRASPPPRAAPGPGGRAAGRSPSRPRRP